MILKNMSCRPVFTAPITFNQLEELAFFDLDILANLLLTDRKNLAKKASEFYLSHKNMFLKAPSNFMISTSVLKKDMVDVEIIYDIPLLINVFTRTYGNIYIPNKEMSFVEDRFKNNLYFNLEDLVNGS